MNDDLPELFRDVVPRPAPAELRAKTLAAVGHELARRQKPRWERIAEWSVAASLALGIGSNVWLWQSDRAAGDVGSMAIAKSAPAKMDRRGGRSQSGWASVSPYGSERYRHFLNELSHGRVPESL